MVEVEEADLFCFCLLVVFSFLFGIVFASSLCLYTLHYLGFQFNYSEGNSFFFITFIIVP